MKSKRIYRRIK